MQTVTAHALSARANLGSRNQFGWSDRPWWTAANGCHKRAPSEDDSWCQQYVELSIETDDGDFDPDDVTVLVGITPTRTARRGELAGNGQLRTRSTWSFQLGEWRRTYDTEAIVCELLDVLDAHRAALERLPEAGLSAGLSLVVEMYSAHDQVGDVIVSTPALSLGPKTIRRIADMNLSLDCDQYVL